MADLLDDVQVQEQEERWLQTIDRFHSVASLWCFHARRMKLTMCRGWCQTAAVDGVHLFWNPEFTAKQNDRQLLFLLFHEVFHIAAGHIWRGQRYYRGLSGAELQKVLRDWGHAIDYAIHQNVVPAIENGVYPEMEFIPAGLFDAKYIGMSAEQIYEDVKNRPDPEDDGTVLDYHILRGDSEAPAGAITAPDGSWVILLDGDGNPLTPGDDDPSPQPLSRWSLQNRIYSDDVRVVDTSGPTSKHSWKDELQKFVVGHARGDYSYSRPNRHYLAQGLVVPGLYAPRITVKFAIDFSASMSAGRLDQCGAEIEAAREQIGEHEIELIPCNTAIPKDPVTRMEKTQTVTTGQPLDWRISAEGGTDFRPVFDYLARKGESVTCLLYFTDGDGPYPAVPPSYPVLWVLCPTGGGYETPPWGEVVHL